MATTRTAATHGTVYALKDPRSLEVRYIGATVVPLAERLSGHLTSPASEPLRKWINELKSVGLRPVIEPLRENVPLARLAAAEKAEIHRRTMRRESLLNVNGKAAAHKILTERAARKSGRQALAQWRARAARIRAVVGPIPPGFDTVITLSDRVWHGVERVAAIYDGMDEADKAPPTPPHEIPDPDNYLPESARLMCELGGIADQVDRLLLSDTYRQLGMDDLTGLWEAKVRECVTALSGHRRFADRQEACRYLSLIKWYLAVMPPWRTLATRCGVFPSGPDFREWVTDDENVRTALRIVEKCEPFIGRAADDISGHDPSRPWLIDILQALAVIYSRQQPEPSLVGPVLRFFARHGNLDNRMAKMLIAVDPHANDNVYGPDHAARIDRDLNQPAGTADAVIQQLATLFKYNRDLQELAARSTAQLPIAALPDVTDTDMHAPCIRALLAAFAAAGRLKVPEPEVHAYLTAVQAWWTPHPGPVRS